MRVSGAGFHTSQAYPPRSALAVWEVGDGPYECWETKAIVAAVELCMYPDGKVGTILPIDFL